MQVFSRLLILFLLIHNTDNLFAIQDVLLQRIYKYNNLEGKRVVVDSSRVLYNLAFHDQDVVCNRSVQIIQSRGTPIYNFSFFYLLIALFFFSMIRYLAGISYRELLSSFFSLKYREAYPSSFFKNLLLFSTFILLFSFFLFQLIVKNSVNSYSNFSYFKILFSCIILLLYKYVLFHFISYVFNFMNKISEVRYIIFDFMYIFVFISLPLIFIASLMNPHVSNSILISILAIFILLYLFIYFKIFSLNLHLLTRNVFKGAIYFYIVEIIPILLLLKYLKLL